jgi:hypothetical protein
MNLYNYYMLLIFLMIKFIKRIYRFSLVEIIAFRFLDLAIEFRILIFLLITICILIIPVFINRIIIIFNLNS